MHTVQLARKTSIAMDKIMSILILLSVKFSIEFDGKQQSRSPQIKMMKNLEAIAAFLESLSEALEGAPSATPAPIFDFRQTGVSSAVALTLVINGYTTIESVKNATDEELSHLDGVGTAAITALRSYEV